MRYAILTVLGMAVAIAGYAPSRKEILTMNLISLKCRFALSLFLVALVVLVVPAFPQATGPCVNQSPRQVVFDRNRTTPPAQGLDYNFISASPLVQRSSEEQIQYQGHTLYRCDKHYHVPVENIQGCSDESVNRSTPSAPLPIDQWIEIHTVYASEVSTTGKCATGLDHDLECCLKPPFVVIGSSAKVAATDSPLAYSDWVEWSGSTTGKDDATGCKPVPAEWHFGLGCNVTMTPKTIEDLGKAHPARPVQSPQRVSVDLTLLPLANTEPNKTCRAIATTSINSNAEADRVCPGVCRNPLNKSYVVNGHSVWRPVNGGAVCECCALDRPQ
jgi:hypothetical protein